jgi:hypothetical protein
MGKRKLLKAQDRLKLFDVPADEDSLIRRVIATGFFTARRDANP